MIQNMTINMKNVSRVLVLGLLAVLRGLDVCDGLKHENYKENVNESNKVSLEHESSVLFDSASQYWKLYLEDSLNVYAPVSDAFHNDLCRNHSQVFRDGVLNNKFWALRMFDASLKLPAGIFAGNVIEFGNYEQCLEVEDIDSEFGKFSGQHCMVAIGKRSFATEIDFIFKKEMGFEVEEFTDENLDGKGVQYIMSKRSMTWSVCVPSSCRPHDVELHLRSTLRRRLGDVDISVIDLACNTRAIKTELSFGNWFALSLIVITVILVVSSTLYDYATSKTRNSRNIVSFESGQFLLAFSMRLHVRRLLRQDNADVDNLLPINGIKILSMMWVMVFHHFLFVLATPAVNHTSLQKLSKSIGLFSSIIINGTLSVDVFFIISGLLMSFNYLKERERGIAFNLMRYYLHRYIRLTPVYASLLFFTTNLYLIDGIVEAPFWRLNSHSIKSNCANWLYSMIYVHNYVPCSKMCLLHTWYLSADMQLFWLSPLILYPLWKWPAVGKCVIVSLTTLGAINHCAVAYSSQPEKLDYIIDNGEFGAKLYYPTHSRFMPWTIGIGVGYALHVTKHTSSRLSRATVAVGWVLGLALMLLALLPMYYFIQPDSQYEKLTTALYLGLMRPAWALGLAWCTFALIRGYGGFMGRFLSSYVFQVLCRLSYSIYLIHFIVMWSMLAFVKTSQYTSVLTIMSQFLLMFICTVCSAVIAHLVYEVPPIYIESICTGKSKKKE